MDVIITDREILSQVSKETTIEEVEKLDLILRLREASKHAWVESCGLSAIQIGIPLRFAWYVCRGKTGTLINPVILHQWGSDIQEEGCLSIPNKRTRVERAWTIEYTTRGKKKKVSGFIARVIQHEIDHMDGILNIDRAGEEKGEG